MCFIPVETALKAGTFLPSGSCERHPSQTMSLRGGLCRSNLLCYRNCWSKEDCHAATPALAGGAKAGQERRLAMTPMSHLHLRTVQVLRGGLCRSNLMSQEDCFGQRASAPSRKIIGIGIAMTCIYGGESFYKHQINHKAPGRQHQICLKIRSG